MGHIKRNQIAEQEIQAFLSGMEVWTNQLPEERACVGVVDGRVICAGEDVTKDIDWHQLLEEAYVQEFGHKDLYLD